MEMKIVLLMAKAGLKLVESKPSGPGTWSGVPITVHCIAMAGGKGFAIRRAKSIDVSFSPNTGWCEEPVLS